MDKLRNAQQTQKNGNVEQLMVEAANELGISADARSTDQDPKSLASRLKRLIRAVK